MMSLDVIKTAILILMVVVIVSAGFLSVVLQRQISPLESRLRRRLHQPSPVHAPPLSGEAPADPTQAFLTRVECRFIALMQHVDSVDAAEFSAGEIERLVLPIRGVACTSAAAQSWINLAPRVLVSLGLLGTFAGLTVGLSRISLVLASRDVVDVAANLAAIVTPMATAFETSLWGLVLSLAVLLFTQLNGTRSILERTEALLSSWLETELPQILGEKISTPLRSSLDRLTVALGELPVTVREAVGSGMHAAFRDKIDEMFDAQATLALRSQRSVEQLEAVAGQLNESGQDFVEAALAFRDSDFASTLRDSALRLLETSERLAASTNGLAARLGDVRDFLLASQADWQLLASAASEELTTCRHTVSVVAQEVTAMKEVGSVLRKGVASCRSASRQLETASKAMARDRGLTLQLAEGIQRRLATDDGVAERCAVFAAALETALTSWNRNVEKLNTLSASYIDCLRTAKTADEEQMADRLSGLRDTIDGIRGQLDNDIAAAITAQRASITELAGPTQTADALSQRLVERLEILQGLVERMVNVAPAAPMGEREEN